MMLNSMRDKEMGGVVRWGMRQCKIYTFGNVQEGGIECEPVDYIDDLQYQSLLS